MRAFILLDHPAQTTQLLQGQLKQQQAATRSLVQRVEAAEKKADELAEARDVAKEQAAVASQCMNVVKAEMRGKTPLDGKQSNNYFRLHTDRCDLISLLSVRTASRGGLGRGVGR